MSDNVVKRITTFRETKSKTVPTEQSAKGGNEEFPTVGTFNARWVRLDKFNIRRSMVDFSRPEFFWIATGKALAMTFIDYCHTIIE